jgi:hypothetical protein
MTNSISNAILNKTRLLVEKTHGFASSGTKAKKIPLQKHGNFGKSNRGRK